MTTKRRKVRKTRRRSCKHGKLKRPIKTKKSGKRRCRKKSKRKSRKKSKRKSRKKYKMMNWWNNLPDSDYSHYDNFFYKYFVPKDKEDFRDLITFLGGFGIGYIVWKSLPSQDKINYIKEYLAYKYYGPQYACGVNLGDIYQLSNRAKRELGGDNNDRLMDKIRIMSEPYYKKELGLVVDYNMVDNNLVDIDNMNVTPNYYLLHFSALLSYISMEILRVRNSTSQQEFYDQFIGSIPCKLLRSHFVKFDTNCSELTQEQADKQECNGDEEFITMDDIDYTRPQDYYIFHDSKHCIKKTDWPELSNGPTGYTNPMTRQAAYCN